MYFDKAFHQHYLGKAIGGYLSFTTSGTTDNLTAGQIGLFLNSYGVTGGAISAATSAPIQLSMGSWHTIDKLNPSIGGLKETQSSKQINTKYVTQFIQRSAITAQNQIVSIGWDQTSGGTGPLFYCGTNYSLKVQALGSPTLWFLNKQMYNNLDAFGGCCGTDCSSGCTSTTADAACVMLQWKDRITQNPYLSNFYQPHVYVQSAPNTSGKTEVFSAYDTSIGVGTGTYVCNTATPTSVVASLQLNVAYAETKFQSCTFTPTDHYEVEPLWIEASLVFQNGDPCNWNTLINTSVPDMFTQLQAPKQAVGLGEGIVRSLITSNRYRTDPFADSIYVDSYRMREIEDDVAVPNVNRAGYYDQYVIIHNVPRTQNPSAVHSADKYALILDVPAGTDCTAFTTLFNGCLTAAGNFVQLHTI